MKEEALDYHRRGRPGKVKTVPTKPTVTAQDLALAYSPGVAEPCREIAKNIGDIYTCLLYTSPSPRDPE